MLQKYEIVQALAERFCLTAYLEIATPTTGFTFGKVLQGHAFQRCHRLLYNCPEAHDDQQPVTFRTIGAMSYEMTRAILAASDGAPPYDLIFVDPFHTYRASHTDLVGAWTLLRPGGFMVVHDCNPENPAIVSPDYVEGEWCGVTYQAYVDFILSGVAESAVTIATDYGVGVLRKAQAPHLRTPPRDRLLLDWAVVRDRDDLRYACFDSNRVELLNLIAEDQFRSHFGIAEPDVAPSATAEPVEPTVSPAADGSPPVESPPPRPATPRRRRAAVKGVAAE